MINYKKSVWTTNTRLSAEALNNIENGIEECARTINELELKIKSLSDIDVSAQVNDLIAAHNINGQAHEVLFKLMAATTADKELEDLKNQVTALKATNTKLTNRVKALENGSERV